MVPRKTIVGAALSAMLLITASQGAWADRGGGDWHHGERGWHGDVGRFGGHDRDHWNRGRWEHGWHGGDLGWWWVIAGNWYWYPQPIYPYPDPYVPPIVVEQQPQTIIRETPPSDTPQYWYYCKEAKAYYPYVRSCPSGWQQVPATPSDVPQ